MNKKMKKALMAGAAMYGASKLAGSDKFLSSGAAGGARLPKGDSMARARRLMTSDDAMNGIKKKSLLQKILNIGPGKNATSSKGGTLAGPSGRKQTYQYTDAFGDGYSGGAKYGKMIKASNGVMVESRGNKLARSKPTKIC